MINVMKALLCLFLAAPLAGAQAQIFPSTRWADPDQIRLNVEFPGEGYQAN